MSKEAKSKVSQHISNERPDDGHVRSYGSDGDKTVIWPTAVQCAMILDKCKIIAYAPPFRKDKL